MFGLQVGGLEIFARTIIVYAALLVALRLAGKRELGQMTPFDLVVILLIANAVQNAMVGPDSSVTGGLIAAGALIGVNYGIARVSDRLPWVRKALEGTPTLLIANGEVIERNMDNEGIDRKELLMAIREHGILDVSHVRLGVLEVDGSISIVPMDSTSMRPRKRFKFMRRGA